MRMRKTFVLFNGEIETVSICFRKAEILVVVTLDRLLPDANRLFKDLFE